MTAHGEYQVAVFCPSLAWELGSVAHAAVLHQLCFWIYANEFEGLGCVAPVPMERIADYLGLTREQVKHSVRHLVTNGYVSISQQGGYNRVNYYMIASRGSDYYNWARGYFSGRKPSAEANDVVKPSAEANDVVKPSAEAHDVVARRPIPQNAEEVEEAARWMGKDLTARQSADFFHYYQARGWKVGRGVATDWHSLLMAWVPDKFGAVDRRDYSGF